MYVKRTLRLKAILPMKIVATDLRDLTARWKELQRHAPFLGTIRNERDYHRMNTLMNSLLAEVGDDESHPLADFLDVVAMLVSDYEQVRWEEAASEPREVLRLLMDQHGLSQSDLRGEVGTQGVVSEILAGTRKINARQAKALAQRFDVSPAVFLG